MGGAVSVSGDGCTGSSCTDDIGSINACEEYTSNEYTITSQTNSIVPLDIGTVVDPAEEGIDTTIEYVLVADTGAGSGDEARVVINAEDVGIDTLSDLDTMNWDVDVLDGYIAHVDVLIDTTGDGVADDALVFEYAKVDPARCEEQPYPTGEMNTFGELGIVNDNAQAWLTTGAAGPLCALNKSAGFYIYTLGDWKSGQTANSKSIDGNTKVLRFEVEVDNWIVDSESKVMNIEINDADVEISLKPSDELTFDILTEIDCLIEGGYSGTLTTTVTAR